MTRTKPVDTVPASDRELVLSRIINAPRDKVFKAWTDPALIKQWFAPLPWSVAGRETHEKMGYYQGWGQCADQLAALVEKTG